MQSELVTLATKAMATRFEIVLWGADPRYLHAVGQEALLEIERLDAQLSLFRRDSDIADLNARAADEDVTVEPRLFRLLVRASEASRATGGAFDITVAPLMRCWGLHGGSVEVPTADAIEAALELIGMEHVLMDPDRRTVHFERPGMMVDLGAIGKGYAIDCAVEILLGNEVSNFLLHGGTSSVYAAGSDNEGWPWRVAIQEPGAEDPTKLAAEVELRDRSLGVSAPHGKWFERDGRRYGHVLDPRTGQPVEGNRLAVVAWDSATEADAYSTALLTLGPEWLPTLRSLLPGCQALVMSDDPAGGTKKTHHQLPPL